MKIKICDICQNEIEESLSKRCILKIPRKYWDFDGTAWIGIYKMNICINCMNHIIKVVKQKMNEGNEC